MLRPWTLLFLIALGGAAACSGVIEADNGAFECPQGVQTGDPVDERCILAEIDPNLPLADGVERPQLVSVGCDRAVGILQLSCARTVGCHGATATLPNSFMPRFSGDFLSSGELTADRTGMSCQGRSFIDVADPMNSYIMLKIGGATPGICGGPMPPPAQAPTIGPRPMSPLPQADVDCIAQWITALAAEANAAGAGGMGGGGADTGVAGMGTAGMDTGTAGMGTAGMGTAGMGTAGMGTAGMGTAGMGTAGMGTAGMGTAGMGTAGAGGL